MFQRVAVEGCLYIYMPGGKRKKTPAPIDSHASCFCRKFYRANQSEIQCISCGSWCHTKCAFPGASDEQVEANEATFQCPTCLASA